MPHSLLRITVCTLEIPVGRMPVDGARGNGQTTSSNRFSWMPWGVVVSPTGHQRPIYYSIYYSGYGGLKFLSPSLVVF